MGVLQKAEQNVAKFFDNLWTTVLKPNVQEAEQVVIAFFDSAETSVENELGVEGLKIVTDAVTAAEQAGGTGVQKLAAAQAAIASDLSAANIENVAQNTINVAIEAAVAQLNASQSSPAVAGNSDSGSTTGTTGVSAGTGAVTGTGAAS